MPYAWYIVSSISWRDIRTTDPEECGTKIIFLGAILHHVRHVRMLRNIVYLILVEYIMENCM
jgi:hypothetical protein